MQTINLENQIGNQNMETLNTSSPEGGKKYPISTEEASAIFREIDGIEPGSISAAASSVLALPINRSTSLLSELGKDPGDVLLGDHIASEAVDLGGFHEKENEIYNGYYLASNIMGIIEAAYDSTDDKDNGSSSPYGNIKNEYVAFTQMYPSVSIETLAGMADFMNFYEKRFQSLLAESQAVERVKSYKEDLVEQLKGRTFSRFLSKAKRLEMINEITELPVVIADPITAVMNSSNGRDLLGWYKSESRVAYIDLASIMTLSSAMLSKRLIESRDDKSNKLKALFYAQLRKTTYHELFHATNTHTYRCVEAYDERTVHPVITWPVFLYEAMTEKAAYIAFSSIEKEINNQVPPSLSEKISRTRVNAEKKEAFSTKSSRTTRETLASSYSSFRLVVDTLFSKLDWTAAGLDHRSAEKLLVGAFFESPKRTEKLNQSSSPLRKQLGEAISKAGHPGMLNKVGMLITHIGVDAVLDVIQSPDFDPHDQSALPWLASMEHMTRIARAQQRIGSWQARLNRNIARGAPENIIDREKKIVADLEKESEEYALIRLATKGLKAELRKKHGYLEDRKYSTSSSLVISIFGLRAINRNYEVEENEAEKIALEAYRKEYLKPSIQKS
jgi:hypothetical protein